MTEIQRVGLILLIAGIVIIAAFVAEKRECERRKAANRKRMREMRTYRSGFTRAMADNEKLWDKQEKVKGETIFHSKDCAEFCGGKYIPKGEAICAE
ncbi:MAG: hypothetical protein IJG06_09590 [Clostridia bacterium]|nr:hypothetical protein [Clostridia bacterium]MBQ7505170.1 hypothetical protein [Ruminococcus sp.]MBR0469884.1 hypothetical protein [Clostridia bacterium]